MVIVATAQTLTPLTSKHFTYPNEIPFQVDTDTGQARGSQFGYNICNSTTEGGTSLCQTVFINSLDDFCLWGASQPNSLIGNTQAQQVAWCTKAGRGTRVIPKGALKGVQFMRTPDYVQVVGFIDQTQVNLASDDLGGELDPHGPDGRGSPIGGLVYSNSWSSNFQIDSYTQVVQWHNFMGGNVFCFKVCDPSKSNAVNYCNQAFGGLGPSYNCPNAASNSSFMLCEGDNQDFPGVYTQNGQVTTFTQTANAAITSVPYTPRVPASSSCQTFQSSSLFNAAIIAATGSSSFTPSTIGPTGVPFFSTGVPPTAFGTANPDQPALRGSGLSKGAIAGMAVGAVVAFLMIIGSSLWFLLRWNKRQEAGVDNAKEKGKAPDRGVPTERDGPSVNNTSLPVTIQPRNMDALPPGAENDHSPLGASSSQQARGQAQAVVQWQEEKLRLQRAYLDAYARNRPAATDTSSSPSSSLSHDSNTALRETASLNPGIHQHSDMEEIVEEPRSEDEVEVMRERMKEMEDTIRVLMEERQEDAAPPDYRTEVGDSTTQEGGGELVRDWLDRKSR